MSDLSLEQQQVATANRVRALVKELNETLAEAGKQGLHVQMSWASDSYTPMAKHPVPYLTVGITKEM